MVVWQTRGFYLMTLIQRGNIHANTPIRQHYQERHANMGMIQDFKDFAIKGNVVDMAVGVIIGASFGKIVSSFVADVVMPPIGVLLGGVDFRNLAITIKDAVGDSPAVVIAYGKFIQTVVDFGIIAFVIFMAVRLLSTLKMSSTPAPAKPTNEEILLAEIRDLLKANAR